MRGPPVLTVRAWIGFRRYDRILPINRHFRKSRAFESSTSPRPVGETFRYDPGDALG